MIDEEKATRDLTSDKVILLTWFWNEHLKSCWLILFFAIIFMTVEGSMMGLLSYSVKMLFDDVFMSGTTDDVLFVGGIIFLIFSLRALSGFVQRMLISRVGQRVLKKIQHDLVAHLLGLSNEFFNRNAPGLLIERVRGDSQKIIETLSLVFITLGRDGVSLFSLVLVAIIIDWKWALIAFVGAPILIIPVLMLQKWIRATAAKSRNAEAENTTRLDEIFHGISAIKLNNAEKFENDRLERVLEFTRKLKFRTETGMAGMPAIIDLVAAFGFFAVMVFGGGEIISGEKSLGEFMSFFTAMALIFEPLRRLSNVAGSFQVALASMDKIYSIVLQRSEILEVATPVPSSELDAKLDIKFDNVSFWYGKKRVLSNISFTCDKGKLMAIVGASGAGKTTILNLIPRLIDLSDGKISIGGSDIKQLRIRDLRNLISVVSQESALFNGTIRSNIIMGEVIKSDEELHNVLRDASLLEFVNDLPEGLDSHVGPRGGNLSGGQRQRILIARALFRNKPILLLDEPTSALDSNSEKIIQQALDKLAIGRTTIVVAHRISTIVNASKILVVRSGAVTEADTHENLLKNDSYYRTLVNSQILLK